MNINEAYIFCEQVANKDQQGLLSKGTFNAFAPAAQMDAILVRAPLYGVDEGITNDLIPLVRSHNLAIPNTGIVPAEKMPKFIRALSITPANESYSEIGECDLLPVDQYRKRASSASMKPTSEFAIASMNNTGLQVSPKNIRFVIFDYIEEPKFSPFWDSVLNSASEHVYKDTTSRHFVMPSSTHIEICARILTYAGLHLSNDQLQNWGLTRASITSPQRNING